MATSEKPKKYKFEIDPWKECRGAKNVAARRWAEGKVSCIKPIKFDLTPSKALNDRKWPEKKVCDEAYYGGPKMGCIMFTEEIVQLQENKKKDDKAKAKELKEMYDGLCKDIEEAVEKWLEEVASGKADNAKALKDGKAAMGKIGSVDFKASFDGKPKACADALKGVVKDDEVDPKKIKDAKKKLTDIKSQTEKDGKDAYAAIKFLLDMARRTGKDKDTAKSLQDFAKEVGDKHSKTFEEFTEGVEEFDEGIDLALEGLEGEGDPERIEAAIEFFNGFTGLASAKECGDIAKKLLPKFKAIEKDLK